MSLRGWFLPVCPFKASLKGRMVRKGVVIGERTEINWGT